MGMTGRRVQPAEAIHTSIVDGDSLRIIIPSPKRMTLIFSISIFMVGWLIFELVAIAGLIMSASLEADRLVWFLLSTAISVLLFLILFWQIRGREVIQVDQSGISLRKEIFSAIGLSNLYSREYIKDLRIAPYIPATFGWRRNLTLYGLVGGFLAFDYGAKTIHFGAGVDEAEAKQIYRKIIDHYPNYSERSD